jgi:hypothetical protein
MSIAAKKTYNDSCSDVMISSQASSLHPPPFLFAPHQSPHLSNKHFRHGNKNKSKLDLVGFAPCMCEISTSVFMWIFRSQFS